MKDVAQILGDAAARARAKGLSYAGELTPPEAWAVLQQPGAVLVDVRSAAEWNFVGVVPGAVCLEWKRYPGMQLNPDFAAQLQQQVPREARVLFLCRSGGRSDETARLAASLGYGAAYNVLEGFEGERDEHEHRGTRGGWKAHGLPWRQG